MTIAISLMVAAATLVDPIRTARFWRKASLWSLVLSVQLAGIIFTLSRGPWVGTIVALAGFIGLVAIFVGWRTLGRASLVLGLALMSTAMITVLPSQMGWYERETAYASTAEEIEERFTSIQREATIGSLSRRKEIWSVSWQVIKSRPIFEFDRVPVSALRYLIGYGPDLFPAAFVLGSAPIEAELLPLETNHAHNYFIQQWVDLGILGFLASVGVFVAVFFIGGYQLLWEGRKYSLLHKVILVGVLSALARRFVEQLVGVAKVSDLVLWWVILAVVVSLPRIMGANTTEVSAESTTQLTVGHRNRRNSATRLPSFNPEMVGRIAVVTLLIAGILVLTWYGTINNVRALSQLVGLNESYQVGDLGASTRMISSAIGLASDVYVYHNNLGTLHSAYLEPGQGKQEPDCSLRTTDRLPYETCLARKVFFSHVEEVEGSPWRWQSRLDLANAAAGLASLSQDASLGAEAIGLYSETVDMVPTSWKLRNQLAKNQIVFGDPEAALLAIEDSLDITAGTVNSAEAFLLQALAYGDLDQPEEAVKVYDKAIRLNPKYPLAYYNRGKVYVLLDQYSRAIEDYNEAIYVDPEYTSAYNNRGTVYALLKQYHRAIKDYDETIRLDPRHAHGYGNRALAFAALNMYPEAQHDAERAVELGVDRAFLKDVIENLENVDTVFSQSE